MIVGNLKVRGGVFAFALLLAWSGDAWSAARFAVATGDWDQTSTWSATSGGAAGASVPVAGDDVTIGETATARTVTIPAGYAAAASSVVLGTTAGVAAAKALTLAANTSSLTVSGNLTVNKPSANNTTNALNVNAGTVTVNGTVTLGGTNTTASRDAAIVITTGTLTIGGDLVFVAGVAGNNVIDFGSSSGTLNLAGAFTATVGTIQNPGTAIFNYNGTAAQTVRLVSSIFYPNLHLNNTSAAGATLSAAISATNVTGNLRVQSGILNNGGFAIVGAAADTFEVAAGARFNLTGTSAMASGFGTRTFAPTSTVAFQGGAQAVASGLTYGNLILSGAGASTKTPAAGTITVAGDFTLETSTTYAGTTNNPSMNLAGDFTNNGTFNSGTGTYTFNGAAAAAQTLTGATTFTNMTVNNIGGGVSLASDLTVTTTAAGALTLTNGIITTNANVLYVPRGTAIAGAGAGNFVAGNLKKRFTTGAVTRIFEVGTVAGGSRYAPVSVGFGSVTGAGDFTVSTTAGDHPQIATSTLDATLSANRYWTLTNDSVGFSASAGNAISFTFVNPDDLDAGADPTAFIAGRYDGASWTEITPSALTATTTAISGAGITSANVAGDYAVAKKVPSVTVPGGFNAYETATGAGAISGVIKTKIAGSTISLDIIALNAARTAILTTFTGTVRVEVLNSSDNTGALNATTGCRASWTTLQTLSPDTAIVSGDSGRKTISFSVANSYPDARLRITFPVGAPTATGCSNDNFAIRPNTFAGFAVTDTDWQTAGTGRALNDVAFGTVTHKAGRPFSVRATALNAAGAPATTTNYAGAPSATLSACAGAACTATFGTLTLGTTFAVGQLAADVASYDNVGAYQLQLVDSAFASVDASDGSTAAERNIISAVINAGRFVPDHFAVALNTSVFGTACGTFTYIGRAFSYTTAPVITVTAQDFANNTTTLYATSGSWWRITNTSLTGKAYSAAAGSLDTSGLPGTDPVIVATGAGVGTLTFGSGTGLLFTRTTPTAPASPYAADVSLAINVIDADGVIYAGNPARFGAATPGNGIGFSNGKQMRFGRLRLQNANGSELIAMPIAIEAQYWNGTAFATNGADNCTTVAAANVALGNYQGNLNAGETTVTTGGGFSAGIGSLRLSAPGAGNNGSVDVAINLTNTTTSASCTAGMTSAAGANLVYLQGAWCGAAYDRDPTARATFGVYRNATRFIYQRENP